MQRPQSGGFEHDVRGPDALHIAVASLNQLLLYTADNDLAPYAEALGVTTPRIA